MVGFDDFEAASIVSLPLTTVRLLLDRMTGQHDSVAREVVVANRLVERRSGASIPHPYRERLLTAAEHPPARRTGTLPTYWHLDKGLNDEQRHQQA